MRSWPNIGRPHPGSFRGGRCHAVRCLGRGGLGLGVVNPVPDTGAHLRYVHSRTGTIYLRTHLLEARNGNHSPIAVPGVVGAEPDKPRAASPELTVLMPCLNEAETVTAC